MMNDEPKHQRRAPNYCRQACLALRSSFSIHTSSFLRHGVRGIRFKSSRNTNAIKLMMNKKPA